MLVSGGDPSAILAVFAIADTDSLLASSTNPDAEHYVSSTSAGSADAPLQSLDRLTLDADKAQVPRMGKTCIKHLELCEDGKIDANNNRVECLNGTLRWRVKVQRGWKSYQTSLAEGQRIAYNFVKPPHGARRANA